MPWRFLDGGKLSVGLFGRSDILDNVGQKKVDKIAAFAEHVTGSSDLKFIQNCQELLTCMPDDRSFQDLSIISDLIARLSFLNECTAVEKFAIARTSRLQRYKADQTGVLAIAAG
jgi:hypothetical protein